MESIGVRELRQRASVFLRRVESGETIQVTDRGRPIALLSPIPELPPLESLRAQGGVISATLSLRDITEPVEPEPGRPLPSETLERMRADER